MPDYCIVIPNNPQQNPTVFQYPNSTLSQVPTQPHGVPNAVSPMTTNPNQLKPPNDSQITPRIIVPIKRRTRLPRSYLVMMGILFLLALANIGTSAAIFVNLDPEDNFELLYGVDATFAGAFTIGISTLAFVAAILKNDKVFKCQAYLLGILDFLLLIFGVFAFSNALMFTNYGGLDKNMIDLLWVNFAVFYMEICFATVALFIACDYYRKMKKVEKEANRQRMQQKSQQQTVLN